MDSLMKFNVGEQHEIHKGLGKPYKIRILAVIDDQVVYKWYGREKAWWHYEIKRDQILAMEIEHALEYNAT